MPLRLNNQNGRNDRTDIETAQNRHHSTISVGTLQDSFESFDTDWTVAAGTCTVDTDTTYKGTQSVEMNSAGNSRARITKTFDAPQDFTGTDWSLAVYVKSTDHTQIQPRLFLRDSSGNQHIYRQFLNSDATERWVRLDFGLESHSAAVDYTSITEIFVSLFDGTDKTTTLNVDDLRRHERPDKAYVMFTFDDGNSSDYTNAYPILGKYGYSGISFVPTNTIGTVGKLTLSQMEEMQEYGWEFGSHTANHVNLNTASREVQERELKESKEWLHENGFERGARHFRTPNGGFNTDSLDLIPEYYDFGYAGASDLATSLRVTEPRLIRMNDGDNYSTAQTAVDNAVTHNRLLGFTLHNVTDTTGFESLISHIHDYEQNGELEVITPSHLLDNLDRLHFPA